METIWIVMLITILLILFSEKTKKESFNINFRDTTNKLDPFFILAIIILVTYSGLRSSIGDTGYYMYSYSNLTTDFFQIFIQRDWGFTLYQFVIKLVFPHPQALLIVTSILTITLVFLTLKKNSSNLFFSVFLFFVSGTYLSSMNGIRQYLVAAILFYASSLIFQGKRNKFFFIVLCTSTLHFSALIMLPMYFVVRQKAWTVRTYILLISVLIAFFAFNTVFSILLPLLEATQYSHYIDNILTDSTQGAHFGRVLVAFVPVFLSFVYREHLKRKLKNYNVYANISLINLIVITFASYHWIFARISIYFSLYNLILLPAIFYYCFDKKSKILIEYLAICFYLIYFYFDLQPHVYASYFLNINRDLIGPLTWTFYY